MNAKKHWQRNISMAEAELLFSQQDNGTLIQVWQQGNRRWLEFDELVIQSAFLLDRPNQLVLPLQHYLLAGCLFVEQPQHVLLGGLGGGDLLRYLSHQFPEITGDAVELSSLICEVAEHWFEIKNNIDWQLHCDAIENYVANCQQQYDLIVLDIAQGRRSPDWLLSLPILMQMKALLTQQGHIAFNLLVADANEFMLLLAAIRRVFSGLTVCASVPGYDNVVVFAFNHVPTYSIGEAEQRIEKMSQSWGLGFNDFYQQMVKDNPKNSGLF